MGLFRTKSSRFGIKVGDEVFCDREPFKYKKCRVLEIKKQILFKVKFEDGNIVELPEHYFVSGYAQKVTTKK